MRSINEVRGRERRDGTAGGAFDLLNHFPDSSRVVGESTHKGVADGGHAVAVCSEGGAVEAVGGPGEPKAGSHSGNLSSAVGDRLAG